MKKYQHITISDGLHYALKVEAVNQRKPLTKLVENILREYLTHPHKESV